LIDTLQTRQNLLRALALYARNHPPEVDVEMKERRTAQHQFLLDALLEPRAQILHFDPERTVQAAVFRAASICRERILLSQGAHARATQQSNEQLLIDVASMVLGLLRPQESAEFSEELDSLRTA
jgi:hypothetical protein